MKTYRHPETKSIKTVNDGADVKEAALTKLGYVEITGADIEGEQGLSVTYEQVSRATVPTEPPALPKLNTPVPSSPTRDTSAPQQPDKGAITREDVQPLSKGDKDSK